MLKKTLKLFNGKHRVLKSGVLLFAVLAAGCAQQPVKQPYWLTPEPLVASHRTELAIARLTEILNRTELSEEQLAMLFYDRGVMYDSVGLRTLARLDFFRALRLKPDMADAYNFIGIHHTLSGEFEQAYDAFDAVLELDPEHQYAYLNRGLALYYSDKSALAVADFEQFLWLDPSDPYRAIWLYLAESKESDVTARTRLAENLQHLNPDDWATKIVQFLLGRITEQELLLSVQQGFPDEKLLAERLCEMYFYLAKWHEAQQQYETALIYYRKTLATNVYEFVEYRYARIEIARLRGDQLNVLYDDTD